MPYWQLNYHIVWTTKNRLPLITPDVETSLYAFLRGKAIGLGATVFALNGVADHVHMVAAVPPRIAVARFIGQVKGVSSTKLNKSRLSDGNFFWQEEYGVFSFDRKRLPNFITYVERQKEHHSQNSLIHVLECTDDVPAKSMCEPAGTFAYEEKAWRREMTVSVDDADHSVPPASM